MLRGRDHIWAYYTRNLVRPVWLSTNEGRVDVVVGNPPWLTYSRSHSTLRTALEGQSKNLYRIWQGGRYAPHQDVAGLFYTRCVDLYLKPEGTIGMVLPHSALQAGQYSRWRTAEWATTAADLGSEPPWDLEKITPNTFFPVPACVIFGTKVPVSGSGVPLGSRASVWRGPQGGPFDRELVALEDTSGRPVSPYGDRAYQGATITPRRLFFVEVSEGEAPTVRVQGITSVKPRLGTRDKAPWKDLTQAQLASLGRPIEARHLHRIHLGETVAPFLLLPPLHAVLPLPERWTDFALSSQSSNIGGLDPRSLGTRMRGRWMAMCDLWEAHKKSSNKLSLLERLDYMHNLTNQITDEHAVRLVYTTSGRPTAAVLTEPDVFIDTSLYWIRCQSTDTAHYLAAIINSQALYDQVENLMAKGAFGARHLHKHLWKLDIPEYDLKNLAHTELSTLGNDLQDQADRKLEALAQTRKMEGLASVRGVARPALREWLRTNQSAQRIEVLVQALLGA